MQVAESRQKTQFKIERIMNKTICQNFIEMLSIEHQELFYNGLVRFVCDLVIGFIHYHLIYRLLDLQFISPCICMYSDRVAYRSDNFIVGLTNVSPLNSTPTLWQYTLCGQYPGAVPASATVSLYCPYNLPLFRYVIVQFPLTGLMSFCELEVIAPGM